MSFLKNIPAMVAGDIRQRLGGAFAPNAVLEILQIGAPAALVPEYTTAYNTAMLVEVDGAYQSWVVYNRVDATTYFSKFWGTNANRGISFSKPAVDIYGLLDDINTFLCTDFTQDEVYNDPIVTGDTVTLRFTDKCKWFTGQTTLPVEAKHRTVNNKVIAKAAYTPNVWRGTRTQTKINPGLLTFSLDYDGASLLSIQSTLVTGDSTLTAGLLSAANAATIAAFLKAKDGLPWQASATAGEFNLYNSILLFNGNALDFNIQRMQYANIAGNPVNDTLGVLLSKFRLPRLTRRYLAVIMVNGTYATNLDQDLLYVQYGPVLNLAAVDAKPDPKPLHHWPLEGNYRNYGKDPKKPELAIRGTFQNISTYDGGTWFHVYADTSASANNSPIGAVLPVDRDFTFTFKYFHNVADTAIAASAVQFWQHSKNTAGTTAGRIGVMADNLFGIDGASYVNAVHSDTKNWPHSTVVTIVREGDEWSIYHDGILRANFRNFTVATVALDTVWCVNTQFRIKDIRYYDVALTPDQVRRAVRLDPALLGDPYVVNKVVPAPQYHFPLKGNLLDKTGTVEFITSQKGTARFNAVTYAGIASKFYYNTYTGQILMGVGFPRASDFTFQWDMLATASTSGAYQLWLDAITSVIGLNLLNGWVRSPVGTLVGSYTPSSTMPAGDPHRWTIVRRGRALYYYLNSKFIYSELVPEGTVLNPLTWIWTPAFLSGGGIKDVKYWNTALSEDQVIASLKEPF